MNAPEWLDNFAGFIGELSNRDLAAMLVALAIECEVRQVSSALVLRDVAVDLRARMRDEQARKRGAARGIPPAADPAP